MSDKWVRDTGLVFVLVALVFAYRGSTAALLIAGLLVLAVLFVPSLLKPLAWGWQKFAEVLGFVMQRIFFGLVFFVIVTPIGFVRRILGKDERDLARDIPRDTAFVPKAPITRVSLERPY
jgi:hypothetical protein